MILTSKQIRGLLKIDFSGKGGKEAEICEALGHTRTNISLVDAIAPDGTKYEYKKQSNQQWFDLKKLADLTEKQLDIPVIFFVHKEGQLCGVYETDYRGVKNLIDLSDEEWVWASKAPEIAQVKYPVSASDIVSFRELFKVSHISIRPPTPIHPSRIHC